MRDVRNVLALASLELNLAHACRSPVVVESFMQWPFLEILG